MSIFTQTETLYKYREFLRGNYMTPTSVSTIPPQVRGNIAGYNENNVSTTEIREESYNIPIADYEPLTAREQLNSASSLTFRIYPHGEQASLGHCIEIDPNALTDRLNKQVEDLVAATKSNSFSEPVIIDPETDYNTVGKSRIARYSVNNAPPLQAFKSSQILRDAGYTVLGMSLQGNFCMTIYGPDGSAYLGNKLNAFFDQYNDIVAQEYAQAQA